MKVVTKVEKVERKGREKAEVFRVTFSAKPDSPLALEGAGTTLSFDVPADSFDEAVKEATVDLHKFGNALMVAAENLQKKS